MRQWLSVCAQDESGVPKKYPAHMCLLYLLTERVVNQHFANWNYCLKSLLTRDRGGFATTICTRCHSLNARHMRFDGRTQQAPVFAKRIVGRRRTRWFIGVFGIDVRALYQQR